MERALSVAHSLMSTQRVPSPVHLQQHGAGAAAQEVAQHAMRWRQHSAGAHCCVLLLSALPPPSIPALPAPDASNKDMATLSAIPCSGLLAAAAGPGGSAAAWLTRRCTGRRRRPARPRSRWRACRRGCAPHRTGWSGCSSCRRRQACACGVGREGYLQGDGMEQPGSIAFLPVRQHGQPWP